MAEYITKEQVMEIYENAYFSAEDIQELRYYFETFINCAVPAEVIELDPNDNDLRQLYVNGDNSSETVTDYNLGATTSTGWSEYVKRYFASFNLIQGLNVIEIHFNNYNWNFTDITFTGACNLTLANLPVE